MIDVLAVTVHRRRSVRFAALMKQDCCRQSGHNDQEIRWTCCTAYETMFSQNV